MVKKFKTISLYITVFLLLAKILLWSFFYLTPPVVAETDSNHIKSRDLITMTNDYRQSLGLNHLNYNARLTQAAVNKAKDLLAKSYFNHTSPEGRRFSQWIREVNYDYFYVGENLAIDFTDSEKLFQAWIDSQSHRDNIVKPEYQEIGIATLEGKFNGRNTIVVVQLFGTRVLSADSGQTIESDPVRSLVDNYFYQESWWEKFTDRENLEEINILTNYGLGIFMGLTFITHRRQKIISQSSIKQPIITRYQAKTDKE